METKNKQTTPSAKNAKKLKKQRVRQLIVSTIGVAILAWGIFEIVCLFLDYKNNETSNDAQIEQYLSPVNLRASGYIKRIYFTEHQDIRKGDTLLVLDDREYRIRVMEAEAALMPRPVPTSLTLRFKPPLPRPPFMRRRLPKSRSAWPSSKKTASVTATWWSATPPPLSN